MKPKVLRLDRLNIHQTKLLNKISFEIRKIFDDYIARISLQHAGNLDWLVSAPASRDLYVSDLFRNLCDLYLIKRLLAQGDNYDSIIVSNFAFKVVLRNFLKKNNHKAKIICKNGLFKTLFITAKRCASLCIHSLIRFLIIGKKSIRFKPTGPVILLDCFVLKT